MSWTRSARDWDGVDCRELALSYLGEPARKSGRAWQWYCPLHADHRTPSFTAYADGYHCFGCGAQGSVVDLVMALERMDYRCAVQQLLTLRGIMPAGLAGVAQPQDRQAGLAGPAQPHDRQAGLAAWQKAGWQTAAWRLVDRATRCLASPQGEPGRAYLAGRGLAPATWQAWGLGYVPQVRCGLPGAPTNQVDLLGPAITLPWTDGRRIKAVQYRLLHHPTLRYWQKAGGDRTLFGVQCLPRGANRSQVLLLVEGELNAISIWQAAWGRLDVVSFGSQANIGHAGGLMDRLAQRYTHVVVWADQHLAALAAQHAVSGRALVLCPADAADANDLLVAGQLEPFLDEVLASCRARELIPWPAAAPPPHTALLAGQGAHP